jgi:nitric oxide reductase activation protein
MIFSLGVKHIPVQGDLSIQRFLKNRSVGDTSADDMGNPRDHASLVKPPYMQSYNRMVSPQ